MAGSAFPPPCPAVAKWVPDAPGSRTAGDRDHPANSCGAGRATGAFPVVAATQLHGSITSGPPCCPYPAGQAIGHTARCPKPHSDTRDQPIAPAQLRRLKPPLVLLGLDPPFVPVAALSGPGLGYGSARIQLHARCLVFACQKAVQRGQSSRNAQIALHLLQAPATAGDPSFQIYRGGPVRPWDCYWGDPNF
jgi:hypothetical protein